MILKPYHEELKIGNSPRTIEEFGSYDYSINDTDFEKLSNPEQVLFKRLKKMQKALPSYEQYLTGQTREVSLDDIRKFVAYPTPEQEKMENCPREYLSVRHVQIDCKFPKLDAHKIGLIDLPGLGELSAGSEEHHIQNLQDDVDFVLFVKRPEEGMAYWRKEDGGALKLLDEARGAIKRKSDFVYFVSNEKEGASEHLVDSMLGAIDENVNRNIKYKYHVLRSDVIKRQSVYDKIVNPVLIHLAERLPVMDRDILNNTNEVIKQNAIIMRESIKETVDRIKSVLPSEISSVERLNELTREMHENIAVELKGLLDTLYSISRNEEEEEEDYYTAIEDAKKEVMEWINNGMGFGSKEEWVKKALRRMTLKGGMAGFAEDEFNRIRVHISNQFSVINRYFKLKVQNLWNQIGRILKKQMGSLLASSDDINVLHDLSVLLERSGEGCPALLKAINDLLELDINYRTHFHPRVRKCLDILKFSLYSKELELGEDNNGPEKLYDFFKNQAAQRAANEIGKALNKEANFISMVLHTTCEQFDDTFIRSGDSEKEFGRFSRSYSNEIWPDIFKELNIQNAYIANVNKAADSIINIVENLEG